MTRAFQRARTRVSSCICRGLAAENVRAAVRGMRGRYKQAPVSRDGSGAYSGVRAEQALTLGAGLASI